MANPTYCVLFEGRVYGSFATNNGTGSTTTDAQLFRNNNCPGAPVMEMTDPSQFFAPFPPAESSG